MNPAVVRSPLARLPLATHGLRIGLYGGSFNPPHAGHRMVAEQALTALRLDRLWWIVTPGNPLKNNTGLPSLASRMAACRALMHDPRVVITGFEAEIGTRYSYDTLRYLKRRCPAARFVWVMGADNLAGFHRWQQWRDIAALMPIAVIDRPGSTLRASASKAAHVLKAARVDERDAPALASRRPPAWVLLYGPRSKLSSTALRAAASQR